MREKRKCDFHNKARVQKLYYAVNSSKHARNFYRKTFSEGNFESVQRLLFVYIIIHTHYI